MEIQKIFSEIDTDEKLYSVLMSEDELALFSELEQREFNSVAQKALRRKTDLVAGIKTAINRGHSSIQKKDPKLAGEILDDMIHSGREANRAAYRRAQGIMGSINQKGLTKAGVKTNKNIIMNYH